MDERAFVVRPARPEDAAMLDAIASQGGLSFQAHRELGRPFLLVLVATDERSVVGFASVQLSADEAEVLDLGVLDSRRREGIGRRLVRAGASAAREAGASRLFLEVRRGNLPAVALYRQLGFLEVGERKRYYRDGEDALVLATLLEGGA